MFLSARKLQFRKLNGPCQSFHPDRGEVEFSSLLTRKQTNGQMDEQTNGQTGKQTNRETNRAALRMKRTKLGVFFLDSKLLLLKFF